MAYYLNDDLEYIDADYFDMVEFDDVGFEMDSHQAVGYDAGLDDTEDSTKHKNDTSASEYRNGNDMQGIPWERLNYTRKGYREMRLKQYKNFVNFPRGNNELEKECEQVEKGRKFYDFQFNTRLVKSTVVHFQTYCRLVSPSASVEVL